MSQWTTNPMFNRIIQDYILRKYDELEPFLESLKMKNSL